MTNKLIPLMYESWAQLDRSIEGLTPEEITVRHDVGSSIAWTMGHVTNMVDSWLNVNFQGTRPNPIVSQGNFRAGGSGEAEDWPAISNAVNEVREAARRFLDTQDNSDLDRVIPYDGSIAFLRPVGLRLGYAVMRITAHHFMHAGEIETIRSHLGRPVHDFPDWGRALL